MSTKSTARDPANTTTFPTFAGLIQQISTDDSLTQRRRQDIASALRTVAKAANRRPEDITADPASLRTRLKDQSEFCVGVSARRWINVLSLLRFSLKHAGLTRIPGRNRQPLDSEWASLATQVVGRGDRCDLSRFLRYCSTGNVSPGQVDDGTFDAFRDDLSAAALVRNPGKIYRATCRAWNRAAVAAPAWPGFTVGDPVDERLYALPWAIFPASLKADIDGYLQRFTGTDLLDDNPAPQLRPISIQGIAKILHTFVSALVLKGRDPESLARLADVVTVEAVKTGLRFHLERSGGKPTRRQYLIASQLRNIARHWTHAEPAHIDRLNAICKQFRPGPAGLTQKNRTRLRQFKDPNNVHALLTVPKRVMERMPRQGSPTIAQAREVQAAIAIAILTMIPLRIQNLTQIDLDRHLVRRAGRSQHLSIPAAETKNGSDIECEIPPRTAKLIDSYIDRFRPFLLRKPSTSLFPGQDGGSKCVRALSQQIVDSAKRHSGVQINPHLVRHISALVYLAAHPGDYGTVRLFLGHKSLETTIRFYCETDTVEALRRYDSLILQLTTKPPVGLWDGAV